MAHLQELPECPVCMEPLYPPIYQCMNGHTLCSNCKPKVNNSCPTCRHEMGDIRNLALEQFLALMEFPCRYHGSGCAGLYRYDCKPQHELTCRFRPFNCPYPCEPCHVVSDVQSLVRHLQHDHGSEVRECSVIDETCHHIQPYSGEGAISNISVYEFEGEHFCFHFEAFASPLDVVYMAFLTFMGNEEDAMKFSYCLQVENSGRRMSWTGMPRSIREGRNRIRDSHDGLVIHRSVAQLLAEINTELELSLRVKGYVLKEEIGTS